MQGSYPLLTLGITAGGALAANRFVTSAGAYPTAAAGARGVTRTSAAGAGALTPIDILGTTIVEAGGSISKDAAVEVGANGVVVAKAGGVLVGYALEAASSGQLIEVLLAGPTA